MAKNVSASLPSFHDAPGAGLMTKGWPALLFDMHVPLAEKLCTERKRLRLQQAMRDRWRTCGGAALSIIAVVGCHDRARETREPAGANGANGATVAAPSPADTVVTADAAPPAAAACREVETATLGALEDYGALQNVRVVADASGPLVTWERRSVERHGDTSQVGFASFDGRDPQRVVALPARSYASAVYTTVAGTVVDGHLDLFAYGVAGTPAFMVYAAGERAWRGVDAFDPSAKVPDPYATRTIPFGVAESLAVAASVPLAVMGGTEGPCESYYRCETKYAAAMSAGLVRSVRSLSFAPRTPSSQVLFLGTVKTPRKPFVPAVAMGSAEALAVYRLDDQLVAQRLDPSGAKIGASLPVGTAGDVGAPAVTFAGSAAYVVWASRAIATEPYRLSIARVDAGVVSPPRRLETGAASAFAPALVAIGSGASELALAWMDGDGGTRGAVRFARVSLATLAAGAAPVSLAFAGPVGSEEGNRRDPELAASGDRVYLAWSDFSKSRLGVPVVRTLDCGPESR